MMPFVSTTKVKGEPKLVVDLREGKKRLYPLNAEGCRQAGAELYDDGVEEWQCSSSVDFPHETKATFRGDVREYMEQGYNARYELALAPRKAVIAKMLAHCSLPEFLNTLTPDEREAFNKIKGEYKS